MGTSIAFVTLGCKVNQYESRALMSCAEQLGYTVHEGLINADLYVVNTCAVTSVAAQKSRQTIAKLNRINEHAKIMVLGCASETKGEQFRKDGVIYVSGADNKEAALRAFLAGDYSFCAGKETGYAEMSKPYRTKTRAYVKIQDGCDSFCSYCIIPYIRGRSRSRNPDRVLDEIRQTEAHEIILTGINMSDYRYDNLSLSGLMTKIGGESPRIRLSSLEVGIIDPAFIEAVRSGNFCRHFHLSLQSGSDSVLRRMNRHYTARQYLNAVDMLRSAFPNCGITTDIIVGFPEESEAEFKETVALVRACGFSDMHIFPYSLRQGTAAAKLPAVEKSAIKARLLELTGHKNEMRRAYLNKNIGMTHKVLAEDGSGYSDNYIKIYTEAASGTFVDVVPVKIYKDGLI